MLRNKQFNIIIMKQKKEVLAHLQEVGYNISERERIMGFLLGKGIIEKGSVVYFQDGDSSFDEFYTWFNNACYKGAIVVGLDFEFKVFDITPKFKPNDKVVITNEHPQYTWEIKDVKFHERTDKSKKGHFRYLLSRDGAEQWVKQSKIELFEEKEEPLYKVGDWMRVTDNRERHVFYPSIFNKMNIPHQRGGNLVNIPYGKVFQIEMHETIPSNSYLYGIEYDGKRMLIGENGIEPYLPKEGEFAVVDTHICYVGGNFCSNPKVSFLYLYHTNESRCMRNGFANNKSGKHRPATEEEKQQLIREVEKSFGVTYCDERKDWFELTPSQIIKKGGKVKVSFTDGSIIIGSCVVFDDDKIVFDNGICITDFENVTKVETV